MPAFLLECGSSAPHVRVRVDTHPSVMVCLNGLFVCWSVRLSGNIEVVRDEGRLGS